MTSRMRGALVPEKNFGALYGEENRCPHCGALAAVESDATYRWLCGVCDAPRVPQKVTIGEEGDRALRAAAIAKRAVFGWFALAIGFGISAITTFVAALALSFVSGLFAGILIASSGLFALVAWAFLRTSRVRTKTAQRYVDNAWQHAIAWMLYKNNTSPNEVAAALGVEESEVETELATLSAQGRTRVDVTEEAKVVHVEEEPETERAIEKRMGEP